MKVLGNHREQSQLSRFDNPGAGSPGVVKQLIDGMDDVEILELEPYVRKEGLKALEKLRVFFCPAKMKVKGL